MERGPVGLLFLLPVHLPYLLVRPVVRLSLTQLRVARVGPVYGARHTSSPPVCPLRLPVLPDPSFSDRAGDAVGGHPSQWLSGHGVPQPRVLLRLLLLRRPPGDLRSLCRCSAGQGIPLGLHEQFLRCDVESVVVRGLRVVPTHWIFRPSRRDVLRCPVLVGRVGGCLTLVPCSGMSAGRGGRGGPGATGGRGGFRSVTGPSSTTHGRRPGTATTRRPWSVPTRDVSAPSLQSKRPAGLRPRLPVSNRPRYVWKQQHGVSLEGVRWVRHAPPLGLLQV